MPDTSKKRALILSSFTDNGTGESFTAGDTPLIDSGAYGNYEAGGLVGAPPVATKPAAKPKPKPAAKPVRKVKPKAAAPAPSPAPIIPAQPVPEPDPADSDAGA